MFKKKDNSKYGEHEFKALDSAVSELSKQTEALLGSAESEEEIEKPTLPKRYAGVQSKAKSFDIIHNPNQSRLSATLKAAPEAESTQNLPEPTEAVETYPADEEMGLPSVSIVRTHKDGALQRAKDLDVNTEDSPTITTVSAKVKPEIEPIDSTEDEGSAETTLAKPEPRDLLDVADIEQPSEDESSAVDEHEVVSKMAKQYEELSIDTGGAVKDTPAESKNESADTIEKDELSDYEAASVKSENTSYHGELYANNLVKDAEPKGYQNDSPDKPVVFDTDEYHPELHDWSKLEHKSSLNWIVLAVMAVAIAAGAYLMLK